MDDPNESTEPDEAPTPERPLRERLCTLTSTGIKWGCWSAVVSLWPWFVLNLGMQYFKSNEHQPGLLLCVFFIIIWAVILISFLVAAVSFALRVLVIWFFYKQFSLRALIAGVIYIGFIQLAIAKDMSLAASLLILIGILFFVIGALISDPAILLYMIDPQKNSTDKTNSPPP